MSGVFAKDLSGLHTHSPESKVTVAMMAISGRKSFQEIGADHATTPSR